jgi:hypothetical protein
MKTKYLTKKAEYLRNEITKATKELELLEQVDHLLPDLDYRFIRACSLYGTKLSLHLDALILQDISYVVEALPPVPLVMFHEGQGGCLVFKAEEAMTERDRDVAHALERIFPVRLDADNINGPRLEAKWFTKLTDGSLCWVEVEVKKSAWKYITFHGRKTMSHGSVYIENDTVTTTFRGSTIISWGGNNEHYRSRTVYWPVGTSIDDVLKLTK